MVAPNLLAQWKFTGEEINLVRSGQSLRAKICTAYEEVSVRVSGISLPKLNMVEQIPFQSDFYPILHRDLKGRITNVELRVRGLGGCFWWWCRQENDDEVRPLLTEKSTKSILSRIQEGSYEPLIMNIKETFLRDEHFQENVVFYVPVLGSCDSNKDIAFDLQSEMLNFLLSPQRVMLILANAGSGKSLFCEIFTAYLWRHYEDGGVIPLFISLPSLKDPLENAVIEYLHSFGFTFEQIQEMKANRRFVFIFDGYDEIGQLKNLFQTNQVGDWKAHLILTCRTQYLPANYVDYFIPHLNGYPQKELFREVNIIPFSPLQRNKFLEMYIPKIESPWRSWEQYAKEIDHIPGLSELTQNPFLLKIAAQVLPDIVIKHQSEHPTEQLKITRLNLYDAFVWRWFERQKAKLILNKQNINPRTIIGDFQSFCKELAKKMTDKAITQVTYTGESNEWEIYFGQTNPRMMIARSGAPLRKFGPHQWGFLHDTLREYFYSKKLM